jgi:hypothetical protein
VKAKIIFGNGRTIADRYFVDDQEVSKSEFDRLVMPKGKRGLTCGVPPSTIASSHKAWPRLSDAFGVAPSQKNEAQEQSIKLGVPTEFTDDGRAILKSTTHQRDLQKALGLHNRDGGYGEVTG